MKKIISFVVALFIIANTTLFCAEQTAADDLTNPAIVLGILSGMIKEEKKLEDWYIQNEAALNKAAPTCTERPLETLDSAYAKIRREHNIIIIFKALEVLYTNAISNNSLTEDEQKNFQEILRLLKEKATIALYEELRG